MRNIILIITVLAMTCRLGECHAQWAAVHQRHGMGDYEGIKRILDTATMRTAVDTFRWYYWMGEYYYWMSYEEKSCADTAQQMFESAIRYKTERRVRNVPDGYCYLHLGEIKYLQQNYDEGIAYLNRAFGGWPYNEGLKPGCPIYKGLGMCYAMKGKYKKALRYLDNCDQEYSGALSVERMRAKVLALMGNDQEATRYYTRFVDKIREEVRDSFMKLEARPKERESWWMSVRPFITDCWRLEKAAPELLYDVALISKGILLQQDSTTMRITCGDVRQALGERSVAIEWMMYEKGGVRRLGAVVMRADGTMRFVRSGDVGRFNEWAKDADDIFDNDSCVKAVWSEEMMDAIGDADRVYFATDGVLNQIGIEYMFPKEGVRLYRLTSTRELLKRRSHDYSSAAIFGDVDYNIAKADSDAGQIGNDDEAYTYIKKYNYRVNRLDFSARECDSVAAIRNNDRDTMFMGNAAIERNFRTMAGRYRMLFVSTHGYSRPSKQMDNSDFPRKDKVDHSLSESGLLFCGYNAEQKRRDGTTDGIVSARELSEMDMRNVELCVVSACEGALGRVSADGTYGVQRGLKAAGVGAMILSLWEVDDRSTSIFMTYMYKAMAEGKTLHDAFWEARQRLREHPVVINGGGENPDSKVITTRRYDAPRYYNSFILIDEI